MILGAHVLRLPADAAKLWAKQEKEEDTQWAWKRYCSRQQTLEAAAAAAATREKGNQPASELASQTRVGGGIEDRCMAANKSCRSLSHRHNGFSVAKEEKEGPAEEDKRSKGDFIAINKGKRKRKIQIWKTGKKTNIGT
jgi:hypothetical protein